MNRCLDCDAPALPSLPKGLEGPLCAEHRNRLLILLRDTSRHAPPWPCGCTGVTMRCPFVRSLRRRAKLAEEKAYALGRAGAPEAVVARAFALSTRLILRVRAHLNEGESTALARTSLGLVDRIATPA